VNVKNEKKANFVWERERELRSKEKEENVNGICLVEKSEIVKMKWFINFKIDI
jgi:hypothetical protein